LTEALTFDLDSPVALAISASISASEGTLAREPRARPTAVATARGISARKAAFMVTLLVAE